LLKIILDNALIVVSVVSDIIPPKYCTATVEVQSVYVFLW
jgi:hypothetical protein